MKIRIIKNKLDENSSREEALGSYIGMVDSAVYDISRALKHIDEDPEYAKKMLIRIYNFISNRNKEIQTNLGINPLNESRYSQFKRSATVRQPSETVHKAVKEVYSKVKELKKIIEFAGRIKNELNQDNNYKKRTAEAIQKLSFELKEISNMLRKEWKVKSNLIKK